MACCARIEVQRPNLNCLCRICGASVEIELPDNEQIKFGVRSTSIPAQQVKMAIYATKINGLFWIENNIKSKGRMSTSTKTGFPPDFDQVVGLGTWLVTALYFCVLWMLEIYDDQYSLYTVLHVIQMSDYKGEKLRFLIQFRTLHYFPLSSVCPSVTGVTSQLSSIIWGFRHWTQYIFWMHLI